jgi:chaperone required for assembly of F1-ATPase
MKKFWKNVQVKKKLKNSFEILLDKRILKTPMQKDLIFSNYKIAKETALEWDISEKEINTENMVFYGLISTAIDKIHHDKVSYIENVLGFINTDLICYRADGPNELVDLQNSSWNPIISFIKKYIDVELKFFIGVMPSKQSLEIFVRLKTLINSFSDIEISALHRMTNLTGSIFISICILKGDVLKNEAFELSFLDELWQAKNWGVEEESSDKRDKIAKELNRIISFVELIR